MFNKIKTRMKFIIVKKIIRHKKITDSRDYLKTTRLLYLLGFLKRYIRRKKLKSK